MGDSIVDIKTEIVIDNANAKKLIELKSLSTEIQKHFNIITSTILDANGALGKYDVVFSDNGGVKLILVEEK